MKTEVIEQIEIPQGVECKIEGNEVICRLNNLENKRKFNIKEVSIEKKDNYIILKSKKSTKKENKQLYTIKAHLKNILYGLKKPFVYNLEIAFVHFPMSVEYDQTKKEMIIKNFLGEKKPRKCRILDGVEVNINKNIITLTSYDKELAGQTATNIEKATQIKNRDRRKFQDGIYIIEKPKREQT